MTRRIASVRYDEEEKRVHLSFPYSSTYIPEKIFSLNRSQDESLEAALQRLEKNMIAAADKKMNRLRKLAKKNGEPPPEEPSYNLGVINERGEAIGGSETYRDAFVAGNYLCIGGQKLPIIIDAPTVVKLTLPSVIMAGYPMYCVVTLENSKLEDCRFTWWRNTSSDEICDGNGEGDIFRNEDTTWLRIKGEEKFMYTPEEKDVGLKIRVVCEPRDGDKWGMEVQAISAVVVQPSPSVRPPCEDRHNFTPDILPMDLIRVVTYNLLAELYTQNTHAKTVLFKYVPEFALDMSYRKLLILKELIGYNGDILCLQEVDRSVFRSDLVPVLKEYGFNGVYAQKSGEATEGEACFYRESKFDLLKDERIIISEEIMNPENPFLGDIRTSIVANPKLKDSMTKRSNVLQVVTLKHKGSGRKIIVANTHLYFMSDALHIRLLQTYSSLKIIEERVSLLEKEDGVKPAVIFCGDLNSAPEFGVYKLFTTGVITDDDREWSCNPDEVVKGLSAQISRTFSSACGTPIYTNYTPNFIACLDYIFHTDDLVVKDVVPLPDHELVARKEYPFIPSPVFPSDHLALVATLALKE